MNDLQLIIDFFKDNKLILIIYILLIFFAYPFENILLSSTYSKFFDEISPSSTNKVYYKYLIFILGILLIVNTSQLFLNKIQTNILPKLEKHLNDNIFEYILKKHQNDFDDINITSLLHKMSVIPSSIYNIIESISKHILPHSITLIGLTCYFLYVDIRLGLLSLLLLFIYFITFKRLYKKSFQLINEKNTVLEENRNTIADKISNLFSIYSNGKLHDEINANKNMTENTVLKNIKTSTSVDNMKNFNNFYNIFILLSMIIFTVYIFKKGDISHTKMIATIIIIMYYPTSVDYLGWSIPDTIGNIAILNKYKEFLADLKNKEVIKEKKISIKDGAITIKNISFSYKGKKVKKIFDNFSLNIKGGQKVAILGNSGNGKSSLIKLIMAYYKVNSGEILIDNQNIDDVDVNDLRTKISYVNQTNLLFNKTVLENIQYGNNLSREEIEKTINKLKINNIFKNLSDGLNTLAGINGNNLSGGQKQMIHILRALCKNNKIIILDEPTSSIDKENKQYIVNVIKELSINKTVIIITHDDSIIDFVDRKIYLDAGKIIKDSTGDSP